MDSLSQMNKAIEYIEDNLSQDIDYAEVAKIACCSEYHFKRMFSFLAGITLSEYIRRRRLTLAAFDLKNRKMKVIDVAIKYGYHSPDSFTRAFQHLHGVTPTVARNESNSLKAYPKMTFHLSIKGGTEMNYRIVQQEAFRIVGLKKRIAIVPTGSNPEITNLLDSIEDDTYQQIEALSNLEPAGIIHVCANFAESDNGEGALDYYVAAATSDPSPNDMAELLIPSLTWVVFEVEGEWDDIQDAWGRIYSEWFPSSNFEHADGPEILASRDNKSEIWIPVVQK